MNLYIMYSGGFYKIGIADKPEERLDYLQGGNPYKIELLDTIKVPSRAEARGIEREIHNRLSDFNQRREWFNLNAKNIDILNKTLQEHDYEIEYEIEDNGKKKDFPTVLVKNDIVQTTQVETIHSFDKEDVQKAVNGLPQ